MGDGKIKKIIFSLVFSLFLHLVIISGISLRIEGKNIPLFYNWSTIVNKNNLFISKEGVVFPKGIKMSFSRLRNDYFFPLVHLRPLVAASKEEGKSVYSASVAGDSMLITPDFSKNRGNSYLYLWERQDLIPSMDEQKISYNVYVSGQGKILFLYPEILPVDSKSGLYLQAHIQKSAMFFSKRFSWTKLEEIVK